MDSDTPAADAATPSRGRVLQEPADGEGLISIGGRQHPFTLRDHWRSDAPPRAGAWVDADFDGHGALRRVSLVDERTRAGEIAGDLANVAIARARDDGLPWLRGVLAVWRGTPGMPALAALGLTLFAWTCLDLIQVHSMGSMTIGLTLWQLLQLANSAGDPMALLQGGATGHLSAGFYGVLALAALALPLALPWVRHRFAPLLLCAPLLFMVVLLLKAWRAADNALASAGSDAGALGSAQAAELVNQMQREVMHQFWQAVGFGMGLYLGVLAALALAALGVVQWRARPRPLA